MRLNYAQSLYEESSTKKIIQTPQLQSKYKYQIPSEKKKILQVMKLGFLIHSPRSRSLSSGVILLILKPPVQTHEVPKNFPMECIN